MISVPIDRQDKRAYISSVANSEPSMTATSAKFVHLAAPTRRPPSRASQYPTMCGRVAHVVRVTESIPAATCEACVAERVREIGALGLEG